MQRPSIAHRVGTRLGRPAAVTEREGYVAAHTPAARLKVDARAATRAHQMHLWRQGLLTQQDGLVGLTLTAAVGCSEGDPAAFPVQPASGTDVRRFQ